MAKFEAYYREVHATFGYRLGEGSALAAETLNATEGRLGVRVPEALRDYYLVAGREQRFAACLHRLLPPDRWSVDQKRLIFMEENQGVCVWGVSVRNPDSADPPVSQGVEDERMIWQPEHRKCSTFLAVMLHLQAVSGGLPHRGEGELPGPPDGRLDAAGWRCHGEVNGLLAYSRPNQVACLQRPGGPPFGGGWSVQAGAKTARNLKAIAEGLGIALAS